MPFEGVVNVIKKQNEENAPASIVKWANSFMNETECPECHGQRLKKEALYFRLNGKNIAELADMDVNSLSKWLDDLPKHLDEKQKEKINENTIQRAPKAASSVDYDLIRQIVESVVDEKLNGITSALNESVSHGSPSLSVMSIKNSKFLFLDDNNNIFECQMVYKGKNKAKRK